MSIEIEVPNKETEVKPKPEVKKLTFSSDSLGEKIDNLKKHRRSHTNANLKRFISFKDVIEESQNVDNVDQARHILYYIFQPLFDSIINNKILNNKNRINYLLRKRALWALDEVIKDGREFLSGFYLGNTNIELIKNLGKKIGHIVTKIEYYYYKQQNVETNYIYLSSIGEFIYKYITYISENNLKAPDTIIGCACGSMEMVLALSGILKTEVDFIRCSKRREDPDAIMIVSHRPRIKNKCFNKNVLVIEDYVVSSNSISKVTEKCLKYKPSHIMGACVNGGTDIYHNVYDYLHHDSKIHLFKLVEKQS